MKLFEHDDRLVATNDDHTKAVVWSIARKVWAETGGDFPRRAWADGEPLTEAKAKKRFPGADFEAIPDLDEA